MTKTITVADDGAVVVVSGGRDERWTDEHAEVLTTILILYSPIYEIWHGGAPGIDEGARVMATKRGIGTRVFPPEPVLFEQHAAHALVARVEEMIDDLVHTIRLENRRGVLVAFPGGPGTDNAVTFARRRHVATIDLRQAPLLRTT